MNRAPRSLRAARQWRGAPELPTRAGQQYDVVHVADVVDETLPIAQPVHAAVERG